MANTTEGAKTGQIDQEIEALDREAREALDRLADKREELERRHRATELAEQRSRERAEEEAKALAATLKELVDLDPVHRRAVEAAHGEAPKQLYGRTFSEELRDWFRGRFKGTIRGIGGDLRQGLSLPERDALTSEAPPADDPIARPSPLGCVK